MEKWIYSGEQIHDLSPRILYHAPRVREFLDGERKFILLSAKGMGKTHLLRQKRKNLSLATESRGAVFIPSSSGSDVDRQTSLPKNISAKVWDSITQDDWASMWEIAIALSALLNSKIDLSDQDGLIQRLHEITLEDSVPDQISDLILEKINGDVVYLASPTFILNSILDSSTSFRQKFVRSAQNRILQLYPKYIKSAVYIFIDSIDQTLTDTYRESVKLWINGQMGLALAAYNIFVNCPHIKVFTAIRQEAWNKFAHQNKLVMSSCCSELVYSKSEMRKMVSFLCSHYEKVEKIEDIFNLRSKGKIRNFGVNGGDGSYVEEDMFDYIYRHSVATPRSVLHLMDSICTHIDRDQEPDLLEKALRSEVNLKSGSLAQTKIESEMSPFLECLGGEGSTTEFFAGIHSNILTRADMIMINKSHSRGGPDRHPFCELYNIGLLGVLKRDADGGLFQSFKKPMEFDWRLHECMPASDYYLLHPTLEAYLSDRYRINTVRGILIDPGAPWRVEWNSRLQECTVKIFISYSTKRLDLRDKAISSISDVLLRERIRHEFWIDEHNISASDVIARRISEGVQWADVLVALVTNEYIGSRWCMSELEAMQTHSMSDADKKALPFTFGDADRKNLGALFGATLIPNIDETDAASMLQIGQSIRKHIRTSGRSKG
jgi:Fe-S cluster biosynthesis and repair protein YggX